MQISILTNPSDDSNNKKQFDCSANSKAYDAQPCLSQAIVSIFTIYLIILQYHQRSFKQEFVKQSVL